MAIGPLDSSLNNALGTLGAVLDKIRAALDPVQKAFKAVGDVLTATLLPPLKLLQDVLEPIGRALTAVASAVRPALTLLTAAVSGVVRGVAAALAPLTSVLRPILTFVDALTGGLAGRLVRGLGAVLGGVGTVLRGTFGLILDGAVAFSRGLLAVVLAPFAAVGQVLGSVAGYLAGVVGTVARAAQAVGGALAAVGGALFAAGNAVVALGQTMGQFVGKANPAAMMQFQLALDNLFAVVGAALVPVFNLLTDVLKTVGDALTLLIPAGAQLAAALQPLIELLGEVLAGAIGILAEALKHIIPVFGVIVRVVMDALNWIGKAVRDLLSLIGIELNIPEAKKGAAVGMAARPAQIGAVEDVLKRAQQASFGVGLGAMDPAKATASAAEEIRKRTDAIYAELKDLPGKVEKWITTDLPNALRAFMTVAPGQYAQAVGPTATGNVIDAGMNNGLLGMAAQSGLETLRYLDRNTFKIFGD